ncbi:MAG: response regulator [Anaerolineae bacterium]|nr:response regulator [Anaerolineae bacterium]
MSTPRIMIVEDESIVALDMRVRLTRLGYQVVGIANTAREGIALASTQRPDLALMDIRLKGDMDGIETATILRAEFQIPVVYLTAYADDTTLARAKPTQPLGYLIKPFEERELHSTIEMALYKIKAEAIQKEQAARMERLVATIPDGVILLDAERRVMMANVRAQCYLETLADAGIGQVVTHLGVHALEDLIAEHGTDSGPFEIVVPGTPAMTFEVTLSPVQADFAQTQGQPGDLVMVIRDVTADRLIQQRIRDHERLAAVGQLAAGIAHDFNNILASIMVNPQIIQRMEPSLSPRTLERLDAICEQAKRGSDLIRQILDFSRASAMEVKSFDLGPLLKELTQILERTLPDSIRLEVASVVGPCIVNGDATRIFQLLMNLAVNARDAMAGKSGVLRVEITPHHHDELQFEGANTHERWVQIQVRDTGSGIKPQDLPHIFEPFFTTKPSGKGTGLGLAQVYGIVQQHGGQVFVDSEVGQGTLFSVMLPAPDQLAYAKPQTGKLRVTPSMGEQQTILLVEDNALVRQSIAEILEISNFTVLTAANGRQALTLLEENAGQVELILSDLDMPEMNGLQLCRTVRANQNDVHFIILSGYISDEDKRELESLQVAECINKPADVERLLCTIEEVLDKSPVQLQRISA